MLPVTVMTFCTGCQNCHKCWMCEKFLRQSNRDVYAKFIKKCSFLKKKNKTKQTKKYVLISPLYETENVVLVFIG